MKKFITSAGLAALGLSTLQAAHIPAGVDGSKPWSISAALRGFYDDNYNTAPDGPAKLEAFGYEVTPSFSLNLPLDQTFIGLSYVYSLRWFEERPGRNYDQSHQVNLRLDHAFSERYKVEISDSFVVAQEPQILDDVAGGITVPFRTEGDNIRNKGEIDFTIQMTRLLGLVLGYANTYYNYEQDGIGSRSALLDRMEHLGSIDLRWQALPQTIAILGYQFGVTHYTGDDPILINPITLVPVDPDDRDNRSHFFYVGVDQNFSPQLNASIRAGVQHVDYEDSDLGNETDPFLDASLTYTYNPGSYLLVGARYAHHATDVAMLNATGDEITSDAQSATLYVSLAHKITSKLTGSLIGQYQHSSFNGGAANSDSEQLYVAGANLTYKFNQHWSAETGYNFDKLDSEVRGRDYDRHRVYIGVRATY